jgi:multiple sugar transport system substrate-binding protein
MTQEPKKVSRRKFIYIGIGAAILVVCGAAVYLSTRPPPLQKVTWWIGSWSEDAAKQLKAQFEKDNPGITIEINPLAWEGMHDKMVAAFQSGNAPDILDLLMSWTYEFAAAGWLLPLEDYNSQLQIDWNDFFPSALQTAKYKGKIYSVPFRGDCFAFVINTKLFKDSGLDPSNPPKTWDDVLVACEKIKSTLPGEYYPTGFGLGQRDHAMTNFEYFCWSFGSEVLIEEAGKWKAAFNNDKGIKALDFMKTLYEKGYVPKGVLSLTGDDIWDMFVGGKIAMMPYKQYGLPLIQQKAPDMKVVVSQLPRQPDGLQFYNEYEGFSWVVNKNSKNLDATLKFLKFLSSPQNQAFYTHTFPARKSAFQYGNLNFYKQDWNSPELKVYAEALNYGHPVYPISQKSDVAQILMEMIHAAFTGTKSSKQAIEDAVNQINKLLGAT